MNLGFRGKVTAAEPVTDIVCELGEAPLWSASEQRLYWVDVPGRRLHHLDPATGKTATLATAAMAGSLALHKPGLLLIAWRNGLSFFNVADGTETPLPSGIDFAIERFNDGRVDRRGRFFVGTMDRKQMNPLGGLYRVGLDRHVTRLAGDIQVSNGIAWSPDNRTIYHCDSRPGRVLAYDFDEDNAIPSNPRVFLDFTGTGIAPDGCTVDADGCLWLAEVGAGRVGRYAPDGRRIGEIEVPARRVTSVMFGGRSLETLFITTHRYAITPEEVDAYPLSGRLFAATPGVKGVPEVAFAG
jgi:sugar lactone lactonase YvrE